MPPPGPTPEPASRGRGPLVLVVEDEFLLAMDLGLLLEGHGFRVPGPAATVAEALPPGSRRSRSPPTCRNLVLLVGHLAQRRIARDRWRQQPIQVDQACARGGRRP